MDFRYCHRSIFPLIVILSLINVNLVQSSFFDEQCENYCSSGGICLKSRNGPKCICMPEWKGERCDIPQQPSLINRLRTSQGVKITTRDDMCAFVPADFCNNKGVCVADATKFTCECSYPYEGDFCEDVSDCYQYCMNNGICMKDNGKAECTCAPEWAGNRCQKPATTTVPPSTTAGPTTTNAVCSGPGKTYCQNGGTCYLSNNQIACQCPPTHTGNRCEKPAGGTQGPNSPQPTQSPPQPTQSPLLPTQSPLLPTQSPPQPTQSPPQPTQSPPIRRSCATRPCKNGGVCYNSGNSYFCDCPRGVTGNDCENGTG